MQVTFQSPSEGVQVCFCVCVSDKRVTVTSYCKAEVSRTRLPPNCFLPVLSGATSIGIAVQVYIPESGLAPSLLTSPDPDKGIVFAYILYYLSKLLIMFIELHVNWCLLFSQ